MDPLMRRLHLVLAAFAVVLLGLWAVFTFAGGSPPNVAAASLTACSSTLSPGANVESAVNSASPGATICLSPGTYTSPTWHEHGGVSGSPVTLTSTQPSNPALLSGRFVTAGTASWITIRDLKFTWSTAGNSSSLDDSVVLGTPHITFVHNDVSGASGHICVNGVEYGGHRIENSLIDHNLVHDCLGDELHEQGIYMLGGPGDVISNNWVWNVAARCYQIRGEKGGRWEHNVCAESREGFIFGDLTPSGNVVEHNVVATVKDNSAYTFGSVGSGNIFANNCISKGFGNNAGVSVSNNTVAAAQFINAAAHDYTLTAGSPCQGDGVLGEKPGPGTEGSIEPTPIPEPTPTETTPPPPPSEKPAAPTGVTASSISTSTSPGVAIKWSAVSGATSYKLFRAGNENIEGRKPGEQWGAATSGTQLSNHLLTTLGGWYCYRVAALSAAGQGPYSAPACATA